MRKNYIFNKTVKGLYTRYRVKGLNLDRLIESLKKNDITLVNVKKHGRKEVVFGINFADNEKFFAIINNVWYNVYDVKRLGEFGPLYPLFGLIKNIGAVLGAALFIFVAVFSNDFIFSFSFKGSGSVLEREITEYLETNGITKMSRFSAIDLKSLGNGILAENDGLTFVSCVKKGYVLEIESVLSERPSDIVKGNASALVADCDGVIEEIKVYRGTARKAVGESVLTGEVIADGEYTVKGEKVVLGVIATAVVICDYESEYFSDNDNEEVFAEIFAREKLGEKDILSAQTVKLNENEKYKYKTVLRFRRLISVC